MWPLSFQGDWGGQAGAAGRSSPNRVPAPYFNEGRPLWGRTAYTRYSSVRLSSVPSGDRSANPVTYGVSGRSDLQRAHLSLPPGYVAELRCSPPLRGSLEQLVRLSPAGVPFQDTKLAALITPEASLQRLVPLVGTWRCGSPCQACLIGSCLQALVLPV